MEFSEETNTNQVEVESTNLQFIGIKVFKFDA